MAAVDVPTAKIKFYDETPKFVLNAGDVDAMATGLSSQDGMGKKAKGRAGRESIARVLGKRRPLWRRCLDSAFPKISVMVGQEREHSMSILAQVPCVTRREALLEREAWVNKFSFNVVVGIAIVVNAVATYIDVDVPKDTILSQMAMMTQVLCFIVFTTEFLFRLGAHGMMYFANRWLQFDFVMLVAMQADVYFMFIRSTAVASVTTSETENTQYRAMRAFRVMRCMKMLNYIQLVDALRDLFLLCSTLVMAIGPLFRIFAILAPFIWTISVLLTELHYWVKDAYRTIPQGFDTPDAWQIVFLDLNCYFGSMPSSSFTMFAFATSNGWSGTLRRIREVNPAMALVAFLGMVVINLVFFNTCISIIVDKTVVIAIKREGMIMDGKRAAENKILDEIKEIFAVADTDNSGEISFEEFIIAMQKPSLIKKMQLLDIPMDDMEELFSLLDTDGGGTLTITELISGILKIRGQASARDLVATYSLVRHELKRANEALAKVDRIIVIIHAVSARLDNWWSQFEAVGLNHDEKLAERRMWFVRSHLKDSLKSAGEESLTHARDWGREHFPPPIPAKVVPAPPTEAPPSMDRSGGRRSSKPRRR
jgi:hypothetical protein